MHLRPLHRPSSSPAASASPSPSPSPSPAAFPLPAPSPSMATSYITIHPPTIFPICFAPEEEWGEVLGGRGGRLLCSLSLMSGKGRSLGGTSRSKHTSIHQFAMASTDTRAQPQVTTQSSVKWASQLSGYLAGRGAVAVKNHAKVDIVSRAFLSVTGLVAVIVMVTSKQDTVIPVSPVMTITVAAKFTHSASFTYFVAALSVAFLYGIITGIISYLALKKQGGSSTEQLIHLVILDSLMLAIVAAATGAAGGVAYEALKGNPHIRWNKICHVYDIFCRHLGVSVCTSLLSSMTLLALVWISVCVLAKNSGRR
ncbi:hypothetical protein L6452_32296 [Arctium lappa]|uniref:Uncharacterized protein n=1 Tax=Arctium lappa TaxID=4217 RepID=A0ACB8Z444_ARCLA|nr:hypothetical protein L6452_32296 [Arctium lappa]